MSKIKVNEIEKVSGSGITVPTGTSFTVTDGIAATNLSGTIADARLPTVPVSKGGTGLTSLGSAGQALKVNSGGNALEFGAVAGGKLLQVQNLLVNNVSSVSTTSTSFQDSALTDQITPAATSSKILVMVHLNGHRSHGTGGNAIITVKRAISGGATTDIGGNQTYRLAHTYVTSAQMTAFFVYDSPNTTSAIDYTVQYRTDNTNAACEIMRHTGASTITLMEIGA